MPANWWLILGLVALPVASLAQDRSLPPGDPAALQVDAGRLAQADSAALALPALLSLLMTRHGQVVFEHYYHGADAATPLNIKSASKSVVSALVGIARQQGTIPDLDRKLATVFPELYDRSYPPGLFYRATIANLDSIRRGVTLRHLLTMTSGYRWEENGPITDAFIMSSNPVRFGLELPMEATPGQKFNYTTAGTHILSAALTRLTGMSTREFGEKFLFGPAGIDLKGWATDLQGIYVGGAEVELTTRGMTRFGLLYLGRGAIDGRQVVPREWVDDSWALQVEVPSPRFVEMIPGLNGYGYLWWRRKVGTTQFYCALGYGGQFILVVPDLDVVIAGGSALDQRSPGTMKEMLAVFGIVDSLLIPAVRRGP